MSEDFNAIVDSPDEFGIHHKNKAVSRIQNDTTQSRLIARILPHIIYNHVQKEHLEQRTLVSHTDLLILVDPQVSHN